MEVPEEFQEFLQTMRAGGKSEAQTSGAVRRRQELDEEAQQLGGKFSSVEEFVQNRLPESQQRNSRRRKKEWNPSKRVTNRPARQEA